MLITKSDYDRDLYYDCGMFFECITVTSKIKTDFKALLKFKSTELKEYSETFEESYENFMRKVANSVSAKGYDGLAKVNIDFTSFYPGTVLITLTAQAIKRK